MKTLRLVLGLSLAVLAPLGAQETVSAAPVASITAEQLDAAWRDWCGGLLAVSRVHREGGDYRAAAEALIDGTYNYAAAPVLFKPTLAHGEHTFRVTRAGALSYFVGGDPAYPEDTGFALKGWTAAVPRVAATYFEGALGISMGHIAFTNADGHVVTVEKTFVFRRCEDGALRIVTHNSSLPYVPAK